MAENATDGQQPATETPTQGPGGFQLGINAQFVKDLSFENPRAPQSLMQPQKQPEVQINVDVKARSLGQDLYEVLLTIAAEAKSENEPVFMVELAYGAVVTAKADNQDVLPLLILVEAPRIIFPFARNIIAEATRDGGFPPLMLNPIDFSELLRRQQQKAAAEQPTATA